MKLPRAGREYARWDVSGAPDDAAFEVQFIYPDGTVSDWFELQAVNGSTQRILVAGPDVSPGSGKALPLGTTISYVRLVDTPEIIIRSGGTIEVS